MTRFRQLTQYLIAVLEYSPPPPLARQLFVSPDLMCLVFFRPGARDVYKSLRLIGPARLAILSSRSEAQWRGGTWVELKEREVIDLPVDDYSSHFVAYQGGEIQLIERENSFST